MVEVKTGDAVKVYSQYHGYYYIPSGTLESVESDHFTVRHTYGGRETVERLDNANYTPELRRDTVTTFQCVECGHTMTGRVCQFCGGF